MNQFELTILDWIQNHVASGLGDKVMSLITHFGDGGIFWIALCIILVAIPKTRKLGLACGISLAIEAIICNLLMKPLAARIRPYDLNPAVQILIKKPTDYSFPSGHTGASFAFVSALFFSKSKYWIPSGILSVLIAFSRMYLYVHYPTDVLAGMLLGILTGLAAVFILKQWEKRKIEKDVNN